MDSDREILYAPKTMDKIDNVQDEISMQMSAPYVVNKQPTLQTANLLLGPSNTTTNCPFCYASVVTRIKYTTTNRTHRTAFACGLCCFCCCLPYCMTSTRNVDHYCPHCARYLGTYEK